MKKVKFTTLALCLLTVFSCSTKQEAGALADAGGGAALGATTGRITGNTGARAIIGGAVGASAGAMIGHHIDKVAQKTVAQVENAKVEEVKDKNGLDAVRITFDNGILFASSKANLNQTNKNELTKFSTVLKNNKDCHIGVYGHTNSTSNDGINIPLSNDHARSVVDYLKGCGVPSSQFQNVVGQGNTQPVADNATKTGRQLNRRVEMFLYASPAMIEAADAGTLNQ